MKLSTQIVMLVKLFHHSMRLSLIVDKLTPLKKLSRRQASFSLNPWITKGLRNSIKVKNHLYSKFLKTKSELLVGPYSIPPFILKTFKHNLSKPLETIFSISISTGCVPDDLKVAKVIPIFKKGLRTCLSNYRPVSLLSNLNKIL